MFRRSRLSRYYGTFFTRKDQRWKELDFCRNPARYKGNPFARSNVQSKRGLPQCLGDPACQAIMKLFLHVGISDGKSWISVEIQLDIKKIPLHAVTCKANAGWRDV
jgi:hypothetical protein